MANRSRSHMQRLASLMEAVEWQGNSNWKDVQEKVLRKYILDFKAWLKSNIKYLNNERAREVLRLYYLEQEPIDRSRGEYNYLEQIKLVMYALYQKEQDFGD